MNDSITNDQANVELSVINMLLDNDEHAEAVNAYEQWVWKWERRLVDIGGTAHMRIHQPQTRRRRRRR